MSARPEAQRVTPGTFTPSQMERRAEAVAAGKAGANAGSTFVLAMLAGAFIGVGATFMLVVRADSTLSFAASTLLGGLAFLVGLFLVLSAGLNGGAPGEAAIAVATGKVTMAWEAIFFRGILCNMLVCLAVWIGYSATSVTDRFFAALLPIMAFIGSGFEHCVANMFLLPYALMLEAAGKGGTVDLGGVLYNLSASTLGNIVGGMVLVGVAYWVAYGRVRKEG